MKIEGESDSRCVNNFFNLSVLRVLDSRSDLENRGPVTILIYADEIAVESGASIESRAIL